MSPVGTFGEVGPCATVGPESRLRNSGPIELIVFAEAFRVRMWLPEGLPSRDPGGSRVRLASELELNFIYYIVLRFIF